MGPRPFNRDNPEERAIALFIAARAHNIYSVVRSNSKPLGIDDVLANGQIDIATRTVWIAGFPFRYPEVLK